MTKLLFVLFYSCLDASRVQHRKFAAEAVTSVNQTEGQATGSCRLPNIGQLTTDYPTFQFALNDQSEHVIGQCDRWHNAGKTFVSKVLDDNIVQELKVWWVRLPVNCGVVVDLPPYFTLLTGVQIRLKSLVTGQTTTSYVGQRTAVKHCKYQNGIDKPYNTEGPKIFTFQDGEKLDWVVMRGNGRAWYSGLGYLGFHTTKGRNFAVGSDDTTAYEIRDVYDKFLAGFVFYTYSLGSGVYSGSISGVGIVLSKVTRARLSNFRYQSTFPDITGSERLAKVSYCNQGPTDTESDQVILSYSYTKGHERCFESTVSTEFGVALEISALIPRLLVEDSGGASWSVGNSTTNMSSFCETSTEDVSSEITRAPQTIPARTSWTDVYYHWKGTLRMRYYADLTITYQGGHSKVRRVSGMYDGMESHDERTNYRMDYLENVTSCEEA